MGYNDIRFRFRLHNRFLMAIQKRFVLKDITDDLVLCMGKEDYLFNIHR